jgi:hypothetical protein
MATPMARTSTLPMLSMLRAGGPPVARNPKAELAADIGAFTHDPLGMRSPHGGKASLRASTGPRAWQRDVIRDGRPPCNPATRHSPCALPAPLAMGSASRRYLDAGQMGARHMPDTRVVVTANTEGQLLTKTSPELAKWQRLALTRDWFRSATSITSVQAGRVAMARRPRHLVRTQH